MKLSTVTDIADVGLLVGYFAFGLAIPPFVRVIYFGIKFANKHYVKV